MSTVEWILVVMLSVALFIFLVAGIVLAIKLIHLAEDAKKVIETSQSIAVKADDIVDNVKGILNDIKNQQGKEESDSLEALRVV